MQIQSDCDIEKSEFSHGEAFFKAWIMMHFAQPRAQPLELFITGDTVIAHRFAKPGYTGGGDAEATLDQGSFLLWYWWLVSTLIRLLQSLTTGRLFLKN